MTEGTKRVLLIMPAFFNYPDVVKLELERIGYEAYWVNDRPSNASLVKALVRINRNTLDSMIEKHFLNILALASEMEFSTVLVISGQSLSFNRSQFERLRNVLQDAKFVFYQWDAVQNYPYILKVIDIFDEVYSFDPSDAAKYNFRFLPLFYYDSYYNDLKTSVEKQSYLYDISFVGTAHPKKYAFVKKAFAELKHIFPKSYSYLFLPSRLVYLRNKIMSPEYKGARFDEFRFTPLPPHETQQVIRDSYCVFDSPQARQTGLTMRTFECMGMRKKLITTNTTISEYDFYNPKNIYIYKGEFDFNDIFFNSEFETISEECLQKYSLNNWLKVLLGINKYISSITPK